MGEPGAIRSGANVSKIGRYRIIDRLGKGAMGIVYRAHDDQMDRDVAVKVMMADLEAEPDTRARFYREAKVTSQLLHRNIVTIFDLGEDDGRLYIVMELLRGETLNEFLKRPKGQSLEQKLDLMMQICEGLSVAHAKGVFHRDIKPANMLVMQDGSLKILDFGVARLANSTMTASGFIVGTPDYMSPEQAQGMEVDARSDIFSAAGVFYFILTGRKPFEAPDLPAVLNRVMREDPLPLRESEAPEPLARILMKALAKDPARRYQSCNDLFADLVRFKRYFESETRKMTTTACERYQRIVASIAEVRTLRTALGTSAGTLEADLATLQTRYPMFEQPENELRVGSFQRARIEEVLADLPLHHDRIAGEISAMRAGRAALDSAEKAMAAGDLRLAFQQYEACLRAVPDCAAARAGIEPCRRLLSERRALEDRCRSLLGEARSAALAANWASTESLCDQVLAIDAAHVEASTLRDRARTMIAREAEQRTRQFQQLCEHALGAIDKRRFGDCEEFLRQARALDPSSDVLPAIEVRLADEERQQLAQQRSRAAEASLKTARKALRARDFARATWAAENAVVADPGNAEGQQLLEQARVGQAETDAARKAKKDETVDLASGSGQTTDLRRPGAPLRNVIDSVGGWASTMLKRVQSPRGQTTTEWLMIAGVLTAVSVFILGIVPGALNQFVRSLAAGIRTVAP